MQINRFRILHACLRLMFVITLFQVTICIQNLTAQSLSSVLDVRPYVVSDAPIEQLPLSVFSIIEKRKRSIEIEHDLQDTSIQQAQSKKFERAQNSTFQSYRILRGHRSLSKYYREYFG